MTKQEVIDNLKNTKVYVAGKSKEIQEKLFELGFTWLLGRKVQFIDSPFLYLSDSLGVSAGESMTEFVSNKGREVTAEYILRLTLEERPEYEFEPFDRVLVRDSDDEAWTCNIFSNFILEEDSPYSFWCISGSWIQCIPYEGNEHLVGTNNKPE